MPGVLERGPAAAAVAYVGGAGGGGGGAGGGGGFGELNMIYLLFSLVYLQPRVGGGIADHHVLRRLERERDVRRRAAARLGRDRGKILAGLADVLAGGRGLGGVADLCHASSLR